MGASEHENEGKHEHAALGIAFGSGAELTLTFADGPRLLPAWVVAVLGGTETVEAMAQEAATVTFGDFCQTVSEVRQQQAVNSWQRRLVAAHLRGPR